MTDDIRHNLEGNELPSRLAAGDHAAFDLIHAGYRKLLLKVVQAQVPTFDSPTADDIVQEVFTRLWEHRQQFAPARNLKAVLRMMAKNIAVDRLRDQQRRFTIPLSPQIASPLDSPPEELEHAEQSQRIAQACAHLTDAQRQTLELKLAGLSAKEIAAQIGCTPKAAQRRNEIARQHLQDVLSAENQER